MTARRVLSTLVVLLVVTAVACSGTGEGDDAADDRSAVPGVPFGERADEDELSATAAGGTGASSAGSTSSGSGQDGGGSDVARVDLDVELAAVSGDRRIVYRGKLDAVVEDVAAAVGAARDVVAAEGGFLFGQEMSDDRAQVVFKVPSPRFDAAFDAVADVGEVRTRVVEADDVTEQYMDLDSRRQTLATSIGRLRGFLDRASNVDEIARLESELTRREAEHDVIVGKLRVLDDRTEHATITATFLVVEEELPMTEEDQEAGPPGFGRGLAAGWDAVTVAAAAAATAIGFALPFVPAAVALAAVLWWWRRPAPAAERLTSGTP